jgi:hypothetical protein
MIPPKLVSLAFIAGCESGVHPRDPSCIETFYADVDGDGHGSAAATKTACSVPEGFAAVADDCNDGDANVHPNAAELCNDVDDDCDFSIDDDPTDPSTWYADVDTDGYGDPAEWGVACDGPPGFSANAGDCNDLDPAIHPDVAEVCDAVDNDCDLDVDEGLSGGPWYRDADGDGHGDPSIVSEECAVPEGYVASQDDCDDLHVHAYDGAPASLTDGVDDACDGITSITATAELPTWRSAGTYTDAAMGVSVAPGDFDGDGPPDLAIGGNAINVAGSWRGGKVSVFSGPLEATGAFVEDTAAAALLYGETNAGPSAVFSAGDLDTDGSDDLLVCHAWSNDPAIGHVYVVRGPITGTIDLTVDVQAYASSAESDGLGICATPGDVDGDSVPDLVIAAPGSANGGSQRGIVYVLSGPAEQDDLSAADQILEGALDEEHIGHGVTELGDVDGDGLQDFSVTNASDLSGSIDGVAAYLVTDHDFGVAHPRDVGVTVRYDLDSGTSNMIVSRLDDIDGDGYGDVAFATSESTGGGTITAVLGPFGSEPVLGLAEASLVSFYSSASGEDPFLLWATPLGDWNGDGSGAVVFADPTLRSTASADLSCGPGGRRCQQGGLYVLAEPIGAGTHNLGIEADRIEGDYDLGRTWLGWAGVGPGLQGGSDLNADGYPDLAFGAYGASVDDVNDAGAVYVLFGGGSP